MLQLGHGISSVETSVLVRWFSLQEQLQLGHGISSVETWLIGGGIGTVVLGFNWATEFPPWKRYADFNARTCALELQLGHGISSVET